MNWVVENNFQAGFTPFSSLLVFKDFTFCLYGDVLRDRIHNDDLQRNYPGYQRLSCSRVRCGGNFRCRPKADTASKKSETALEKSLAPRVQRNRSLQHFCGIVSNYISPNLAELKIVVVNPVE